MQEYTVRDRMLRALSEDGTVRAVILSATEAVNTARVNHKLNPLATIILGELMMGALLAASSMKDEDRVTLRLETSGPLQRAVVEATAGGEVRGYLNHPQPIPQSDERNEMIALELGDGFLHVSRQSEKAKEPITSSVQLLYRNITRDLTHYFAVSEQVPTALQLSLVFNNDFSVKSALGFMLQAMPGATEETLLKLETGIIDHPSLSAMAQDGLYIDAMLQKITAGVPFRELSRNPVDFFCRCTKKRFERALFMLPVGDLKSLSDADQVLSCHYCGKQYTLTRAEIEHLVLLKQNTVTSEI